MSFANKKGRAERLARLEGIRGGGPPCPECEARGLYTSEGPTYELLLDDDFIDAGMHVPEDSVYCATCGELTFGVLEFPDETPTDDPAGAG